MVDKRQLNIRLPVDLYELMSNSEGSMVGIIEAALREHFEPKKEADNSKEVSILLTQVEYLKSENIKLMELLSREQIKSMDLQNKLMPAQEEQKEKGKHFWEFWK
jgi:hypothetical protein